MVLTALFVIVFCLLVAERALELALNRRNARRLAQKGAVWLGNDGFEWILAAQLLLFMGTAAEVILAPEAREGWWTLPLIGVLVLAQALRYWCIATLGERWNIRVVTLPGAPRITGGPYRFFSHPNYLAVMIEVVALPLAFGAWRTALVVGILQLAAILNRVRYEERALQKAEPSPR